LRSFLPTWAAFFFSTRRPMRFSRLAMRLSIASSWSRSDGNRLADRRRRVGAPPQARSPGVAPRAPRPPPRRGRALLPQTARRSHLKVGRTRARRQGVVADAGAPRPGARRRLSPPARRLRRRGFAARRATPSISAAPACAPTTRSTASSRRSPTTQLWHLWTRLLRQTTTPRLA